ncbi:MAG: tRNA preQ1(34) S-adenosylmethionine ribosyltransferase-isomerase QueA [Proteobacteria bacterium]|nr:tRNA preQ1(34) S-adenosylmethionine ribosyltransferase-isomerase QueA [Pseudomonadota bacterium]
MDTSLFDFELPSELIALRPAEPRGTSRMLVVDPAGERHHAFVADLPGFLRRGDCLVVNDTKVMAARLHGRRRARDAGPSTMPKIEVMLHKRLAPDRFLGFARPARKLAAGDRLILGTTLEATVVERSEGGEIALVFAQSGAALDAAIAREGELPLPPYIAGKRPVDARDAVDYQTTFADKLGSVAAPTAGLHLTDTLFRALGDAGIGCERLTLHVGAGTFLPVTAADTGAHRMHGEWAFLPAQTAECLNAVRASGGRIVAVGTTSLRTLETAADADGRLHAFEGETDIFITPGYRFRAVDVLLTNFHLPRSTLFMLVSAFCGLERMHATYAEAIRNKYRFYSYGDACLLFRPS